MDVVDAVKILQDKAVSYGKKVKVVCANVQTPYAVLHRVKHMKLEASVLFVTPSIETHEALLGRCQCIFMVAGNTQERIEGNPFPYLLAMKNGIPVISGRSPLVEETLGKHRIDYCVGSPQQLVSVIRKSMEANGLLADICRKNKEKRFSRESAREDFIKILEKRTPVYHDGAKKQEGAAAEVWINHDQYVEEIFKKAANT